MELPRTSSIGDFIREQREAAQVSVRQLAHLTGVSNPYLSQIERGLRKPSAEILQQIARGLSISAEQLYTRAGLLESRVVPSDVTAAILADGELSERHKHVLVEIYESFRRESVPDDSHHTVDSHGSNSHTSGSHHPRETGAPDVAGEKE